MNRFLRIVLALIAIAYLANGAAVVGPEYGREEFLKLGRTALGQVTNVVFSVGDIGTFPINTNGVMVRTNGTYVFTNGIVVGILYP